MNEITLHGNITSTPELRVSSRGVPFVTFTIAINRARPDGRGGWTERPAIFQRVVAFHRLAQNVRDSLGRGTAVTITGQLADDSFTPDGTDRQVRRTKLEASDVAVSLRFATAAVTRNPRRSDDDPHSAGESDQAAATG